MSSDSWEDPNDCWVAICNNTKAHRDENLMFGRKIPLAETDAFELIPASGPIVVSVRWVQRRTNVRAKGVFWVNLRKRSMRT